MVVVTSKLKDDDLINVKDFGAIGDNETDDTVAIQAAFDFAGIHGGHILFPAGSYKITR